MTAGKGFIALAALIFAKWRPWPALGACLLFGFLEAIGIRYQDITLGGVTVPVQFMQALPYILTVVILAGFVGKAIPPKAGGRPYVKERCDGRRRDHPRPGGRRPGRASAWCSAPASGTWPARSTASRSTMPTCPGFPHAGVSGHQPKLVVGDLEGVRVAVLGGRAHYYERGDAGGDAAARSRRCARSAPSG